MRWYMLRTLLHKEILRQLANRGGLALAALLVVASFLLAVFNRADGQTIGLVGGVERCFVDYAEEDDWVQHLRDHRPEALRQRIEFRRLDDAQLEDGQLVYPPGTGAIQILTRRVPGGPARYQVRLWHPGSDGMASYEAWFWRESAHYFQKKAAVQFQESGSATQAAVAAPVIEQERSRLQGGLDLRLAITSALVLFALFFACVYLLASLMCEERERGVLLAQALSPASPAEILAAKFLFYPVAGMGLAALIAGIAQPAVLARPFFWLALAVSAFGALGTGLTIASLARTQRTASMGALCYLLVVALFLFLCQQAGIPGLPLLALEYHGPRMLHAVLADAVQWYHWGNLAVAALLAAGWTALATVLFRQRGWQ